MENESQFSLICFIFTEVLWYGRNHIVLISGQETDAIQRVHFRILRIRFRGGDSIAWVNQDHDRAMTESLPATHL